MRALFAVVVTLLLAGCATAAKQTDAAMTQLDKHTKYAVEPTADGFLLSIYYSRYQYIPESAAVAEACKQALTSLAHDHARKSGRKIEQINEQAIKISMGRNGMSGITSCTAQAPAVWAQ